MLYAIALLMDRKGDTFVVNSLVSQCLSCPVFGPGCFGLWLQTASYSAALAPAAACVDQEMCPLGVSQPLLRFFPDPFDRNLFKHTMSQE